jgi:leucyl aminopeptidase (aminopeptidase T)
MNRVPIQSLGIIPLQAWGNVPAGETFAAPLEDSANGEYLVNGAIDTEKVCGDREAIIQFEHGRMVRHLYLPNNEPVEHILHLKQTANRHGHSNCWNSIADFGIGVNKNKILGVQLIDEKKYGTVHVAIGHNAGYGGNTRCPSVHCDMTTVAPTVTLDGQKFIDRGEHVYDLEEWLDDFTGLR